MDPDSMLNILSVNAQTVTQTISGSDILFKIILLILLIMLNAFFAASEIAIISLNDNKLKKDAEEGNKKAKTLVKLTSSPSSFLATIQVGVTLSGFLASAVAATSFAELITNAVAKYFPDYRSLIYGISTFLITMLLSYFTLVFGELVPKRIAMQKSEKISYGVGGILNAIRVVTKPFIALLTASTNAVVRLFGMDPNANKETVTQEEILMMVDEGEEHGVIEESEREMINNIFEFDDITVDEIMTHRIDVCAIEDISSIDEVVKLSIENGYSRIPVYHDDLDDILGIIYVKDLLKYVGNNLPDNISLTSLMHEPYFVPEGKKCSELFNELTALKLQMAVIADEYGGTSGIVTMEDLLESIVGNIQDEFDDEDEEMIQVNENTFTVDGTTTIDEASDLLDIELPEGDYDTVGGLILDRLKRIPKNGEQPSIEVNGVMFTVESIEDRRIARVKMEKIKKQLETEQIEE